MVTSPTRKGPVQSDETRDEGRTASVAIVGVAAVDAIEGREALKAMLVLLVVTGGADWLGNMCMYCRRFCCHMHGLSATNACHGRSSCTE